MYFPLNKLVDLKENRYEFAKACMEYAKKIQTLGTDKIHQLEEKDSLIALKALLKNEIKYGERSTEEEIDDIFLELENISLDEDHLEKAQE